MSSENTRGQFRCPECGGTVGAGPPVRRALLRYGCVLCGTAVTPDDFK